MPGPRVIVAAIVRRDGELLIVEEREPSDPKSTWMLPAVVRG
jgi:hypothetical protein